MQERFGCHWTKYLITNFLLTIGLLTNCLSTKFTFYELTWPSSLFFCSLFVTRIKWDSWLTTFSQIDCHFVFLFILILLSKLLLLVLSWSAVFFFAVWVNEPWKTESTLFKEVVSESNIFLHICKGTDCLISHKSIQTLFYILNLHWIIFKV